MVIMKSIKQDAHTFQQIIMRNWEPIIIAQAL